MMPDILALAGFAFATIITPGPNNVMLMASGANFGLRRSLPHMAGVAIGFPAMIVGVGLGVMQVFAAWPVLQQVLTAASLAYLAWLALKIARASAPDNAAPTGRPLSFLQASAFQWVNPKAWAMALGAVTLYAAGNDTGAVLVIAATYLAVGCISASAWTWLGQQARHFLGAPGRLRSFNVSMAVLLVLSVLPVVLH
ncbi:transporter, LysE family protein [Oceaniovalibus guishaninsula JLT2003]|uniref:Transporter, LysE family protein n=1 Tax=Oceaniovalibus guishaninsula JLT2003 TaxID=1231392 RepID=K2GLZ8_9RHOB|nr:LysE family translocator [Oceaniovalibus guishaninsula]EKE43746.1 transporter, LysE family protein [Oceaniovalibus guishaninsula JLT2003]